jgi:hypothetical protein
MTFHRRNYIPFITLINIYLITVYFTLFNRTYRRENMTNQIPEIKGQQTADTLTQKNGSACMGGIAATEAGYWAGDAMIDEKDTDIIGTEGALYYVEKGSVKNTVTLAPAPGATSTSSSPAADEVLAVDTRVWATDFHSGNLYRYDVKTAIPGDDQSDSAKLVYTAPGANCQLTGLAELDGILWFIDATNAHLHGVSTTDNTPVLQAPFDLSQDIDKADSLAITRVIAEPDTHSLWILVVDSSNMQKTVLRHLTPTTAGGKTSVTLTKSVNAPYARAIALNNKTLYLVTTAGALNTFDITNGQAIQTLLTIDSGASLSAVTIDKSNVLWCVQSGSGGNKLVYEVDLNAGKVVASYQLDATESMVKRMAYLASEDVLLLPDLNANHRVMKLQPLDHVDKDGKSTLRIKATPEAESTTAETKFATFSVTVTDTAQQNKAVKARLDLDIVPLKDEAKAFFGSTDISEPLLVDATGTDIDNLTAGNTNGQITVQAHLRGGNKPVTIFTGTIGPMSTAISFKNPPPASVETTGTFDNTGDNAQIIQSDNGLPPGSKITLTIDDNDEKGATFGGKKTVTVEDGEKVPNIVAGKFVGKVHINASVIVDGKTLSASTDWVVKVKPVIFSPPKQVGTQKPESFDTLDYHVEGYKEQDNLKSDKVGAAGITVKLVAMSNVYFYEKNTPSAKLNSVELVTDSTGTARLSSSGGKSYYCHADTTSGEASLSAEAINTTVPQKIVEESPQ